MAIVFLPVGVALMQGQDSILLLLFLVAAFAALEGGREFIAGCILGLGLFKFQIVLPIALLFVLWKRWRFAYGFAASAVALIASSVGVVGLQATKSYFGLLVSMSLGLSSTIDQARLGTPPAIMPNLRGLVFGLLNNRLPTASVQGLICTIWRSFYCQFWFCLISAFKQYRLEICISDA
jgi:hypothetical protein